MSRKPHLRVCLSEDLRLCMSEVLLKVLNRNFHYEASHQWRHWEGHETAVSVAEEFTIVEVVEHPRQEEPDSSEDTQGSEDTSSTSLEESTSISSGASGDVNSPKTTPVASTTTKPNSNTKALDPLSDSTTVIGSKSNPSLNNSNSVIIDPRKPASRLSLVNPKPNQSNPPLFPIGGQIEFEWAFDKSTLLFPPSNLTIDINLNSDPTKVWSIANVSGSTTSIKWNTANVARESGLFMGFYTLNIYDSLIGKRGVATGGHLIPSSDLRFGL
ncbi:hypothetical protein BGZ76_004345, partial [Entomortierella beljakovae]